jgi:hypothetical protein
MFVATGRVSVERSGVQYKDYIVRAERFAYGMRVCYLKVQRMVDLPLCRGSKGCHNERKQVVIQDDIAQG